MPLPSVGILVLSNSRLVKISPSGALSRSPFNACPSVGSVVGRAYACRASIAPVYQGWGRETQRSRDSLQVLTSEQLQHCILLALLRGPASTPRTRQVRRLPSEGPARCAMRVGTATQDLQVGSFLFRPSSVPGRASTSDCRHDVPKQRHQAPNWTEYDATLPGPCSSAV